MSDVKWSIMISDENGANPQPYDGIEYTSWDDAMKALAEAKVCFCAYPVVCGESAAIPA